jgi:hypothetical protein
LGNAALIQRQNIKAVPGVFHACIERAVRDNETVYDSTGALAPFNVWHAWAYKCRAVCDQILPIPNSRLYWAMRRAVLADSGPGAGAVLWEEYDYTGAPQRLIDAASVWHGISQDTPLIWQGWQELVRDDDMELNQAMSLSFAAQCGGRRAYMRASPMPWLLLAAGGYVAYRQFRGSSG